MPDPIPPSPCPEVTRVIVVAKPHLDLGYTESAAKVLHDNINWEIWEALGVARTLRAQGRPERFTWTVPAWILHEALERRRGAERARVEAGVVDGTLAWHALPCTFHSELMDPALFDFALSFSQRLDRWFGRVTTAAKMTDVPGHTRGIVPRLAAAGVRFLHVGVNPVSAVPDVPPVFRWRDPETGAELVVAYEAGYGTRVVLPGSSTVLALMMVGDNMEVPSVADVLAFHASRRAEYPRATVEAGTLSDFAATLDPALVAALPVVEGEIGDTWIHGAGSDPWKVARHRELCRLHARWRAEGRLEPDSRQERDFATALLLVAEHTWGLHFKAYVHHLPDHRNPALRRLRASSAGRYVEASWAEQREYLEAAVESLTAPALRAEAEAALEGHRPRPQPLDWRGWEPLEAGATLAQDGWRAVWDPADGALVSLVATGGTEPGRERVAAGGALARLRYQTFSTADYEDYCQRYTTDPGVGAIAGLGRPGLRPEHARSGVWAPRVTGGHRRRREAADGGPAGWEVAWELAFDPELVLEVGAPRAVVLTYRLGAADGAVEVTLEWFEKGATLLPEALWLTFQPAVPDPAGWRFHKLGRWISPLTVVGRGGRGMHAIQGEVRCGEGPGAIRLESPDAPLVAPGEYSLLRFPDTLPDLRGGLHFNLHNNVWSTNFPMWHGDDARCRFRLTGG